MRRHSYQFIYNPKFHKTHSNMHKSLKRIRAKHITEKPHFPIAFVSTSGVDTFDECMSHFLGELFIFFSPHFLCTFSMACRQYIHLISWWAASHKNICFLYIFVYSFASFWSPLNPICIQYLPKKKKMKALATFNRTLRTLYKFKLTSSTIYVNSRYYAIWAKWEDSTYFVRSIKTNTILVRYLWQTEAGK